MAEDFKAQLLLELKDEFSASLERAAKKSDQASKLTKKSWKNSFSSITNNFKKSIATMQAGQARIRTGMGTIFKGVAIAAPLGLALKSATDFNRRMVEIASVSGKSATTIKKEFSGLVEEMQIKFGTEAAVVQKALYDGFSAGVPVTKKAVTKYLDAVGKLATVGNSDMATAADAITTVANAWGVDFEKGASILFGTIEKGKTTLGELTGSLGQISGVAKAMGLSLEETATGIASLTATGMKTPEAITALKGSISSLIRPTKESAKLFRTFNIETGKSAIQNKGLSGIIAEVSEKVRAKTKNDSQATKIIAKMFPNIRALGAVLSGTGAASEKFSQIIKAMNTINRDAGTEASALNTRFSEASRTMSEKFKSAIQKISVSWKRFGMAAIPVATKLLDRITPLIDKFLEWSKNNKETLKTIIKVIGGVSAAVIGLGALNIAIGGITTALGALQLAFSPVGIAVAGAAGWWYVFQQLNSKTSELGKTARVATSSWEGFFAVLRKNLGFVEYVKGRLIELATFGIIENKISRAQASAVADVDRIARPIATRETVNNSSKVIKVGGITIQNTNTNMNQAQAEDLAKRTQKEVIRSIQNAERKNLATAGGI